MTDRHQQFLKWVAENYNNDICELVGNKIQGKTLDDEGLFTILGGVLDFQSRINVKALLDSEKIGFVTH